MEKQEHVVCTNEDPSDVAVEKMERQLETYFDIQEDKDGGY